MKIGKGTIREIFAGLKTKNGRKQLYAKYREIIMYVVFGALTTIISFASYYAARWIFPDAQSVPVWLRWIFSMSAGGMHKKYYLFGNHCFVHQLCIE